MDTPAFVFYLGGGHSFGETWVCVGTVMALLGGFECTDSIRRAGFLQPRAGPGALADGGLRAAVAYVGWLWSLLVLLAGRPVAPLTVWAADLLAVQGSPRRRAQRLLSVVLDRAPTGTLVELPAAPYRLLWAHLALEVGVIVWGHFGIVWLLRHGIRVKGTPHGMPVLFGEPVVPPQCPLPIEGSLVPVAVWREVFRAVQVAGVAWVVVAKTVFLCRLGRSVFRTRLVGSRWALLAEGVWPSHRNAVKLFKQTIDRDILLRSTPSHNGLQNRKWGDFNEATTRAAHMSTIDINCLSVAGLDFESLAP